MKTCVKLTIAGRVQGVGFRWYIHQRAQGLDVSGYVKNLPDGRVEIEAEGDEAQIQRLIEVARKGPSFSQVNDVEIEKTEYGNRYSKFEIAH